MNDTYELLFGYIGGTFFTIGNAKILTFDMYTVFTYFTSYGTLIFNSFTANITKFSLQMSFSPTMRYGILSMIKSMKHFYIVTNDVYLYHICGNG